MTLPSLPRKGNIPLPGQTTAAPRIPAGKQTFIPKETAKTQSATNMLAVASFLSSLAGIILLIWGIGVFVFLGSIIIGHMGVHQIKQTGQKGKGYARAGMTISYIGCIIGLAVAVGFFYVFSTTYTAPLL